MDKYTQRNDRGEVDVAASANAYAAALTKWVSEHELPSEEIATAISDILKEHGKPMTMPALTSRVANQLGSDPATFAGIAKRVQKFVQAQAKSGNLFISPGLGGGVSLTPRVKKTA